MTDSSTTSSWREQVLKEFTPSVAKLTIVADPDGLLLEEGVLKGIHERGFELIPFGDHVAFRYAYETGFRSRWDKGEQTDLVVVLRAESDDLESLPFDLIQAGRKLQFSLTELFPNLSYPVVNALDRDYLDSLYRAQLENEPGNLGDKATKLFILRHVFEIAPELIKNPSDLLRTLLRRHFNKQSIPETIDDQLIRQLRQNDLFSSWPLEQIVPDRYAFFSFLQERWPLFLKKVKNKDLDNVYENEKEHSLTYKGPTDLPFDHDDVRVYIDSLFLEGILTPVTSEEAINASSWAAIGVRNDPLENELKRYKRLLEKLHHDLPGITARHKDWFLFSYRWAELIALITSFSHQLPEPDLDGFSSLRKNVDQTFTSWCAADFKGLHNLPPSPPAMLHHIPKIMARYKGKEQNAKCALLVVDGLSLDQWVTLRNTIKKRLSRHTFKEDAVFAWIPTLTSVSRQSLFSANPPLYFPNSIHSTSKEPALWSKFWVDRGLKPSEIVYQKTLNEGKLEETKDLITQPGVKIAGLIINTVDMIMHGMIQGTKGMHNQIRQWAEEGYLSDLIDLLVENGFHIWLTSDHGNVEAEGIGRPTEGATADIRGERVRVFPSKILRNHVSLKFTEAIEWPAPGLPQEFYPLLAPHRKAFVKKGECVVSHGGISIEEVIVPLVEIGAKNK